MNQLTLDEHRDDATIRAIHARAVERWQAPRESLARGRMSAPIDYESRERAIRSAMTVLGETREELSERLHMPAGYMKHILRKHSDLGLVKQWRDGNRRLYGVVA